MFKPELCHQYHSQLGLSLSLSRLLPMTIHFSRCTVTSRVFEALGLLQNADVAQLLSDEVQDDVNFTIAVLAFIWVFVLLALLAEAMRRLQ